MEEEAVSPEAGGVSGDECMGCAEGSRDLPQCWVLEDEFGDGHRLWNRHSTFIIPVHPFRRPVPKWALSAPDWPALAVRL